MRDTGYKTQIFIKDCDYVLKAQKKDSKEPLREFTDMEEIPGFNTSKISDDKRRSTKQAIGRKMRIQLQKHVLSPGSIENNQLTSKKHTPAPGVEEEENLSGPSF